MFSIVYVPFLYDFTGSIVITGFITTLGIIIQYLPMPWIGRLADKYGRKLIWYFDTPFMVLGLLLFIVANNLFILIAGVLFYSVGTMIGISIFKVFVTENSTETKQGFNYGLLIFALSVGNIAGSYFVLVDSRFNVHFYFFLFIIILIISYVSFIIFISDPIPRKSSLHINPNKTEKGIWRKILTTPKLRAVVIFFTFDAFIYSISFSIYTAGLIDQYQITLQDIALLAFCSNISLLLFQIPAGHLTDKFGKKKTIILSELFRLTFFSLLVITFFLWSTGLEILLIPLLITGEVIRAVNITTFDPSSSLTLTNLDETRRAESYGIATLIRGIGEMPTGIIAGLLIARVHYIIPFIFTIMGIIFLLWFLSKYFED